MMTFLKKMFEPMEATGILIPGVEKPTTTLVKMISASMIKDLPDIDYRNIVKCDKYEICIDVKSVCKKRDEYEEKILGARLNRPTVKISKDEEAILINAFKRLKSLKEQQKKIKLEEQNQNLAVDAIANWMGVS